MGSGPKRGMVGAVAAPAPGPAADECPSRSRTACGTAPAGARPPAGSTFVDPLELGREVALQRLPFRSQLDLVAEDVAADELEPAAQAGDLLRRGRPADRRGHQADGVAGHHPLLDLGDAGRVGQHHLDPPAGFRPPVPGLGVERPLVVEGPGALLVGEERLSRHRREADLLAVVERRDGRVDTAALAPPGSDEEADRFDVRVHHHDGTPGGRAKWAWTPTPPNPDGFGRETGSSGGGTATADAAGIEPECSAEPRGD